MTAFAVARDRMLGLFRDAWDAGAPAVVGGVAPVQWPGVPSDPDDLPQGPFARIHVQHVTGNQTTFGRVGERQFTRTGFVSIQILTPLSDKTGLGKAEALAVIARNAFEGVGPGDGLFFRGVRINEIGPDGRGWYSFNVIADFSYDEQR